MGAASEHRGNACIRRQIELEKRPVHFEMMDRLNKYEKYEDAGTPHADIFFIEGHGGWYAECPRTGFGYWYKTLPEAVRRWRVEITGYDNGRWLCMI